MTDPRAPKKRPACGRRYSPAQKAEILLDARETGVEKAVDKHGCSAWSIYEWRKQQERDGKAALAAESGSAPPEPLDATQAERQALILKMWRQQPGLGPSQIRNQMLNDPEHLGAKPGILMTLHTWSRDLWAHVHIHCLITGGGVTPDGQWKPCRKGFLVPKGVLRREFREIFIKALRRKIKAGKIKLPSDMCRFDALYRLTQAGGWRSARKRGTIPVALERVDLSWSGRGCVQSGSRGFLTPGPHTTQRAGPHWAVHDDGAHESLKHSHGLSSNNRGR